MRRVAGAALGLEDADALFHFLPRMVARAEDGAQALAQRLDLAVEHSRLNVAQHPQRGEEREHLGGVEPPARQLVARAGARLPEPIAVPLAVVLDRRVGA